MESVKQNTATPARPLRPEQEKRAFGEIALRRRERESGQLSYQQRLQQKQQQQQRQPQQKVRKVPQHAFSVLLRLRLRKCVFHHHHHRLLHPLKIKSWSLFGHQSFFTLTTNCVSVSVRTALLVVELPGYQCHYHHHHRENDCHLVLLRCRRRRTLSKDFCRAQHNPWR